jgi:hypothetical protein
MRSGHYFRLIYWWNIWANPPYCSEYILFVCCGLERESVEFRLSSHRILALTHPLRSVLIIFDIVDYFEISTHSTDGGVAPVLSCLQGESMDQQPLMKQAT